ncbi:hypothetical protein BDP67DRAFT_499208 [Colletotrichum lupini]|nr:hypothetical protein BDP67DRAFT_499208 [Colletotrichum lupini]
MAGSSEHTRLAFTRSTTSSGPWPTLHTWACHNGEASRPRNMPSSPSTAEGHRVSYQNKSNIPDVCERAILVRLRWEAKNTKRRARLNVPKTEPFRVPSRHRAAREDETTGDAQLRADLDDAIRQKEALEAELRARPQIEKCRRRTADENAHLEELQAENKELRERLEREASEHAQMEEI